MLYDGKEPSPSELDAPCQAEKEDEEDEFDAARQEDKLEDEDDAGFQVPVDEEYYLHFVTFEVKSQDSVLKKFLITLWF